MISIVGHKDRSLLSPQKKLCLDVGMQNQDKISNLTPYRKLQINLQKKDVKTKSKNSFIIFQKKKWLKRCHKMDFEDFFLKDNKNIKKALL